MAFFFSAIYPRQPNTREPWLFSCVCLSLSLSLSLSRTPDFVFVWQEVITIKSAIAAAAATATSAAREDLILIDEVYNRLCNGALINTVVRRKSFRNGANAITSFAHPRVIETRMASERFEQLNPESGEIESIQHTLQMM